MENPISNEILDENKEYNSNDPEIDYNISFTHKAMWDDSNDIFYSDDDLESLKDKYNYISSEWDTPTNKIQTDIPDTEAKVILNTTIQDLNKPTCTLVNVVSTYNLGIKLNPPRIALWFKNIFPVKYNPKGFAAMIGEVKIPGFPSTTVLIYPSGNVVHTGAKDEDHARTLAWAFAIYLREKINIPATILDFKIRNLVSYLQLGHGVDLEKLSKDLGLLCSFEPSLIQCAIVRDPLHPYLVRLFYYSGSVVLTGSKERKEIIEQYRDTFKKVKGFEMNSLSRNQKNEHKRKAQTIPNIKVNTKETTNFSKYDKDLCNPLDPFTNLNDPQNKKMEIIYEI